jgi:hypothetical protein
MLQVFNISGKKMLQRRRFGYIIGRAGFCHLSGSEGYEGG